MEALTFLVVLARKLPLYMGDGHISLTVTKAR
jgi:hypothetical protein